jgi:hypothetical protein
MSQEPSVSRHPDGYIEVSLNGEVQYDFKPEDHGDALRWVEHLSRKKWATPKMLGEVARLYANGCGVRYR